MIKLLALDLDGTLLNSHGQIPRANKDAICRAEEMGVLVTIATGRRFRDAQPLGLELELNAPLLTHNGALIKYAQTLETIDASLLKTETVAEIVRAGKEFGGDALVSVDPDGKGTLLYDRISEQNLPLQKYVRWAQTLHGDEAEESVKHVDSLEAVIGSQKTIHVSFSGGCAPMEELLCLLKQELGDSVTLLATIYPRLDFTLLDILPPNASKGHGVEKLAKLNGLTRDEVMVMGDNFNDLEMLEFAGTPVVMGNADPALLEHEDFHSTLENNQNGVAVAIERFILNA